MSDNNQLREQLKLKYIPFEPTPEIIAEAEAFLSLSDAERSRKLETAFNEEAEFLISLEIARALYVDPLDKWIGRSPKPRSHDIRSAIDRTILTLSAHKNHRKGISLTRTPNLSYVEKPKEVGDLYDIAGRFADLSGWALIGSRCARCEREGWIDRHWLEARYSNAVIIELAPKLRCRKCGNRGTNRWILGKPHR